MNWAVYLARILLHTVVAINRYSTTILRMNKWLKSSSEMPSGCLFQLRECDYLQLFCVFIYFCVLDSKTATRRCHMGCFWWTVFLLLFTLTHQNTLCVSWRPNKGVGCSKSSGSVCKAKLCEPFSKTCIVFNHVYLRAVIAGAAAASTVPRLSTCRSAEWCETVGRRVLCITRALVCLQEMNQNGEAAINT